jgi:hypothetical protein
MKTWLWMTGGLIVWAVHFIGVYLISSVADLVTTADDAGWRMAAFAFSGLCVLAAAALLVAALRRLRAHPHAFADQVAACGGGVAVIAIVWQALPTVVGH